MQGVASKFMCLHLIPMHNSLSYTYYKIGMFPQVIMKITFQDASSKLNKQNGRVKSYR
jgi:hypothetical protein